LAKVAPGLVAIAVNLRREADKLLEPGSLSLDIG